MVVAEELHFGRAAPRLGMTQPPLSGAIRRLERRLGVTLLLRTSRQVALTAAGEVLLRDGRKALQRWTRRSAGRSAPAATIRACCWLASPARTPSCWPGSCAPTPTSPTRCRSRSCTRPPSGSRCCATAAPTSPCCTVQATTLAGLDTEDLLTEPQIVVLRPDHPLADRESVELAELRGEQLPRWPESAPDPAAAGRPARRQPRRGARAGELRAGRAGRAGI